MNKPKPSSTAREKPSAGGKTAPARQSIFGAVRGHDGEVLRVLAEGLINLGEGERGMFTPRRTILVEEATSAALTDRARSIAALLTSDVDRLIAGVEARMAEAVAASTRSIDVGSKLLLLLNGISQPGGTYGSSASGAMFPNDEYFSGTGVLTVAATPEPGAMSLLILATAGMLRRRRRS